MTDPAQARAYAEADFSDAHDRLVELFREHFPDQAVTGLVLDLGCGSADVSIRFARANPDCRILGVDGARAMLDEGLRAVAQAGLGERIHLVEGYLPGAALPAVEYAAVISNSLLHHLAEPMVLWSMIRDVAAAGTPICVMDLVRPADRVGAERLVSEYAADAPDVLRRDFFNSLLAAYRVDEVEAQLRAAGLSHLSAAEVSDRHLLVTGLR